MLSAPAVTVRNLPSKTHRALKALAVRHGRSTEAEIRAIVETAVCPTERVKLGALLASIGREAELTEAEAEKFAVLRDKTPVEPKKFE